MAKDNGNGSVTVERGDTLWGIASKYLGAGNKYPELAKLNNIKNPDLIYVGQIIRYTGTTSGSSTKTTTSPTTTIDAFGLSADNSSNTLFAVWSSTYTNIDKYEYEWYYTVGDKVSGKDVWYTATKSSTEDTNCTYDIPAEAKLVRFRVKPVSKTYTDSKTKKETVYWTASFTGYKTYDTNNNPPKQPSVPSITIEKLKLKAVIDDYPVAELSSSQIKNTTIEFQVIRNNKDSIYQSKHTINSYGYVSKEWDVKTGNEYKVRCRAVRDSSSTAWTDFSESKSTPPAKPEGLTVRADKKNTDNSITVYLEWKAVNTAKKYTIQYTTNEEYFENSSGEVTSITTQDNTTKYSIPNFKKGSQYWFRVAANNDSDEGQSEWSDTVTIIVGEPPAAPTTWSSTTTAIVGEPLTLYWVHNAKDNSSETLAQVWIEVYSGGEQIDFINTNVYKSTDADLKDLTSFYSVDTNNYPEGAQLRWRVRTAGITGEVSDDGWSVVRTVDIYAKPTLDFTITPYGDMSYSGGITDAEITSFPIKVEAVAHPATQTPTGYYLSITSNDIYETVDNIGNNKMVNAGEQVYSKYLDGFEALDLDISASDVNLDNGIKYTITCTVSMNSGLTATESIGFTVAWSEESYTPNATVTYDDETLTAHIHPYCENHIVTYYKVTRSGGSYVITNEEVSIAWGEPLLRTNGTPIYTLTGEQVFTGTSSITINADGTVDETGDILYYEVVTGELIENILLSVYRREFDGSFTELATNIDNMQNTYITDPHPSLDYARYRIVAMEKNTGAISFYDLPGIPIGEKSIVIQWDEDWSWFDVEADDPQQQPNWSGSLLKLPYNIDVSDSYGMDTALVEYIGRKRPVSYYGTQLGESSTWNTVIPKEDTETLYALRRLAIWTGDVYVREPSGSGYWANITVSFNQKHLDLTIPVTLTLKRVEGGA